MKNGLPFKILVVEDDQDDRVIIDEAFEEIGYVAEVKKFDHGQGMLKYLEQADSSIYPSLILLDNSLPGLDAQHLLPLLKEDARYKSIPVVVYSGTLSDAKKDLLKELGAYSIIEKGLTMQSVVNIAQELKQIAESDKK
jgi:CheY-like chemotaxis protein